MNYEMLFRQVSDALSKREFSRAEELVRTHPMTEKNPILHRSHYMVYSSQGSVLFNSNMARQILEGMVNTFTDPWSKTELARVLITSQGTLDDINRAEDLLNSVRDKDAMAKYYLAEIYSKGLNHDANGPIFDYKEAMLLYKEIFTINTGRIKNIAVERYCRIAIQLGNRPADVDLEVFSLLHSLIAENHVGANRLLCQFLVSRLDIQIDFIDFNAEMESDNNGPNTSKVVKGAIASLLRTFSSAQQN